MAADEPAGPPPATAKSNAYRTSAPVITALKYHYVERGAGNFSNRLSWRMTLRISANGCRGSTKYHSKKTCDSLSQISTECERLIQRLMIFGTVALARLVNAATALFAAESLSRNRPISTLRFFPFKRTGLSFMFF